MDEASLYEMELWALAWALAFGLWALGLGLGFGLWALSFELCTLFGL
jgi:hypothetical protein